MGTKIECIEFYYPEKIITNDDLQREFPEYDFSKFEQKIGIRNRYITSENETALDLAIRSAEKLFSYYDKSKIDYILYCTQSPEYFLPTTACILQDKLKLRKDIGAFDFNLGCSGYTYGLSLAKSLIISGQAENILLVTAETYSKYLHPQDKSNRAIFGDAATSTIVSYSDEDLINEFVFGTDGAGFEKLIVKNGASKHKVDSKAIEKYYGSNNLYNDNYLYMDGPEIFNFTNEMIPKLVDLIESKNSIERIDVDQFILHQANSFMLHSIRKRLKIEPNNFFVDLFDGGNTVSCTIPIALKKYSHSNFGGLNNIVLAGFGVGLSWCGGLIKIKSKL
jgi:3-oxoacyl-[acyl-carrier-protein] synthase-3